MSHRAGRTRWRRFAAILVPGVAASATIAVAMAQGALAASFLISGQKFQVSADTMTARGVSIYGMVDVTRKGKLVPVVVTGTRHASITGLCQSVVVDIPVIGPYTLRVTGGNERPAEASNLFLDATSQTADEVKFRDLDIGIAQGAITKGPINPGDRHSRFFDPDGVGQQAESSTLTNVRWTTVAVTAGTFSIPGLFTRLKPGLHECF
ncbi:DUF6230 family protein [Streptomyces sp. HUAS TT20]|uniref:DUF6230 family protein n=1 Tax=Streptomyces sp. HUAS TT20 TaxID=3447509 RepID=UPI0021D8E029|nr:DUF6230 family protein [Streptomyces sp. HUAS 15-9]UXY25430.1 DUF6230 family protein [Streptomyces sp. HUAS 15-9]